MIDLKRVSIDAAVTSVKHGPGAVQVVDGFTKPEGFPFLVVVAVAKQSDVGILEEVKAFSERLAALGSPKLAEVREVSGWAQAHRAIELAKRELGEFAPSTDLLAHAIASLDATEEG